MRVSRPSAEDLIRIAADYHFSGGSSARGWLHAGLRSDLGHPPVGEAEAVLRHLAPICADPARWPRPPSH